MAVLLAPRGWGKQKPPLGTQVNRSHPLAVGLIAQWLMNEGSGSVVRDSVGISHGIINQTNKVTWQVGEYGLKLNNISTANTVRNIQLIPVTPPVLCYTWEARIRTSVNSDGYGCILTNGASNGLYIRFPGGGFNLDYWSSADHQGATASLALNTDYHFALSQKLDNTFTLYVDGTPFVTGTADGSVSTFDSMFNNPGSETFNGDIYYQRLWNRPLTQSEIQILQADPYCIMMPPQRRLWLPSQSITSITSSDSGSGDDALDSLTVIAAETAAGVEATMLALAGADTAAGVEATALALAGADTGSSDDASSMALTAPDTGSGDDDASTLLVAAADTGSGVDDQQVNPLVFMVTSSDSGSGADQASSLALAAVEVGAGVETSAGVAVAGDDTGAGVDVAVPILTAADQAAGVEGQQPTVLAGDSGVGVDATVSAARTSADVGVGVDGSALVFTAADLGAAVDAVFATIVLAGDTGSGVDDATLAALVEDGDVGVGVDQGRLIFSKLCAIVTPVAPPGIIVSVRVVAPC